MIKALGRFFSILAVVNIIIMPCFAGERLPAGTVLEEESFVFTVEEAQELRKQILDLEAEVAKQKELVESFKELDVVTTKKFSLYEDTITLQDAQIQKHQEWHALDLERIRQLERQRKSDKLEKWGIFALGVTVAVGGVLAGDKIGDFAETN